MHYTCYFDITWFVTLLFFLRIFQRVLSYFSGWLQRAFHAQRDLSRSQVGRVLLGIVFIFSKYNVTVNQQVIIRVIYAWGFYVVFFGWILTREFLLFLLGGLIDVHSVSFSYWGKWFNFLWNCRYPVLRFFCLLLSWRVKRSFSWFY